MKIISFIDDSEIIKKILNHLGMWDVKRKPPPLSLILVMYHLLVPILN